MVRNFTELLEQFIHDTSSLINQGILNDEFNTLLEMEEDHIENVDQKKKRFEEASRILDEMAQNLNQEEVDFSKLMKDAGDVQECSRNVGAEGVLRAFVVFMECVWRKDFEGCLKSLEEVKNAYNKVTSEMDKLFTMEIDVVAAGGSVSRTLIEKKAYLEYLTALFDEGILNDQFNKLQLLHHEKKQGNLLVERVKNFFAVTERRLDELAKILKTDNVEYPVQMIDIILHAFKESSSSIGAEGFLSACVEFKINAAEEKIEGCMKCLEQTRNAYKKLKYRLELLFEIEKEIKVASGMIHEPSINKKISTGVAKLQFEFVDYTASLFDQGILNDRFNKLEPQEDESNVGLIAQNVMQLFSDNQRKLNNLAELLEGFMMNFSSLGEILDEFLGSSTGFSIHGMCTAYAQFHSSYKEKNIEGCLVGIRKARSACSLVESELATLLKMERDIIEAGGTVPRPLNL